MDVQRIHGPATAETCRRRSGAEKLPLDGSQGRADWAEPPESLARSAIDGALSCLDRAVDDDRLVAGGVFDDHLDVVAAVVHERGVRGVGAPADRCLARHLIGPGVGVVSGDRDAVAAVACRCVWDWTVLPSTSSFT